MVRVTKIVLASVAFSVAVVSAAVVQNPAVSAAVKVVGPVKIKAPVQAKPEFINTVTRYFDENDFASTAGMDGGDDIEEEPETTADLLIPENPDNVFMDMVKEVGPKERKPMLDILKKGDADVVKNELAKFKEGVIEGVMEEEDPETTGEENLITEDIEDLEGEGYAADGSEEFDEPEVIEGEEEAKLPQDYIEDGAEDYGSERETGSRDWADEDEGAEKDAAVEAAESANLDMSIEAWEEAKEQAKERALDGARH